MGNILAGNLDSRDLANTGGIVATDKRQLDLLLQRF